MKARVRFQVEVEVEVPDDFCEKTRQLQVEFGENYIGKDWTDQQILERTALIRGVRGFKADEGLDAALNSQPIVTVPMDSDVIDFEMLKRR